MKDKDGEEKEDEEDKINRKFEEQDETDPKLFQICENWPSY